MYRLLPSWIACSEVTDTLKSVTNVMDKIIVIGIFPPFTNYSHTAQMTRCSRRWLQLQSNPGWCIMPLIMLSWLYSVSLGMAGYVLFVLYPLQLSIHILSFYFRCYISSHLLEHTFADQGAIAMYFKLEFIFQNSLSVVTSCYNSQLFFSMLWIFIRWYCAS
jgi:hypothetical protein